MRERTPGSLDAATRAAATRRHRSGTARPAVLAACAAALLLTPALLDGQERVRPLGLEAAVTQALSRATDLRVAEARSREASAEARMAAAVLYPSLQAEAGWSRSDDPVAVFGTKLRQQRFAQIDFALPVLNDPAPATDWTAGARIAWAGLDASAWARREAASREADAAHFSVERARQATAFLTRALYYDAVRTEARVAAASAALEAARATETRFRRRTEDGLLTRGELLQAEAERAAAEAAVLEAERARDEARLELGLHLGWSPDSVPAATDPLPDLDSLPPVPDPRSEGSSDRPDVRALAAGVEAAEAAVLGGRLAWLPVLEAFAGYGKHAAEPFDSDGTAWNVGVGLRWTVFDGFRRPAGSARAAARLSAARAERERAVRRVGVEVRLARDALGSARGVAVASRAAARAAAEGRDLMRRRFEEGLAGAADLLQAEARAARMEAGAVDALAAYHTARARLAFATGAEEGGAAAAGEEGGP